MTNPNPVRVASLVLLLMLLIVILVLGGLIWFDILGLINVDSSLGSLMRLLGLRSAESVAVDYSDLELLDSMTIQKQELAIDLRLQELEGARESLTTNIQDYEERLAQLEEREKILADQENSFNKKVNRYDDRRAGLVQNAKDLTSMRPDDAVAILNEYDDQLLIDTLRTVQELADEAGTFSLVSTYLALLPEDRAAAVQRKMTQKPPLDNNDS